MIIRLTLAGLATLVCGTTPICAQTFQKTELTVFAAASLTEAFQELGRGFEARHHGMQVHFNFGGTQQLVQQLAQGAKADIFASADMKQMKSAIAEGLIDTQSIRVFARNRLIVAIPKANPGKLRLLSDLANRKVKIVLADSSVPVGRYSLQVIEHCDKATQFGAGFKERLLMNVVSYEENVRAVLSKVRLGECDGGIVYSTDIARDSSGEVRAIEIPDTLNVLADYPIAIISRSDLTMPANDLLEYVLSDEARNVLMRFGFLLPNRR